MCVSIPKITFFFFNQRPADLQLQQVLGPKTANRINNCPCYVKIFARCLHKSVLYCSRALWLPLLRSFGCFHCSIQWRCIVFLYQISAEAKYFRAIECQNDQKIALVRFWFSTNNLHVFQSSILMVEKVN